MNVTVHVYPDTAALVAAGGDRLVETVAAAVAARGQASIVLTGGGTGIALLRRVREQAARVDWGCVHVYFGDDRFLPADDDDRNEKQARDALLAHVGIPEANVHPMPASDGEFGADLDVAALAYEQVLATHAQPGDRVPSFDVHLLGMGSEGHVNSLFPQTPAVRETARLVLPVYDSPKPPPQRITLTLPTIRCAREVWLVVSGSAKADAVAAAVGGADPVSVPAAGAAGRERTLWLLDADAAAELPNGAQADTGRP